MYKPQDVFTETGLREYQVHLHLIEQALFFILNNADDLHIGCKEGDNSLEVLYAMQSLLESKHLHAGDGEVNEDAELVQRWINNR